MEKRREREKINAMIVGIGEEKGNSFYILHSMYIVNIKCAKKEYTI